MDLHVGNRRNGVQGETYFVRDIILGPTLLANTDHFKNTLKLVKRPSLRVLSFKIYSEDIVSLSLKILQTFVWKRPTEFACLDMNNCKNS